MKDADTPPQAKGALHIKNEIQKGIRLLRPVDQ
jgi:hypothetical protein